jgi:hypothetical protein
MAILKGADYLPESFHALLRDPTSAVRIKAGEILWKQPGAEAEILAIAGDPAADKNLRRDMVFVIRDNTGPQAFETFKPLVHDPFFHALLRDDDTRVSTAVGRTLWSDIEGRKEVMNLAADSAADAGLRIGMIEIMHQEKAHEAVDLLRELTADKIVGPAAAQALADISKN